MELGVFVVLLLWFGFFFVVGLGFFSLCFCELQVG